MFGSILSDVKQQMRGVWDAQMRIFGGLAFMALAMAAIQYDEIIAPELSRVSDSWSTAATDFSKKLTSFTL